MQDVADVFLNDTAIPDVFITDYMSRLTHHALQVYLMGRLHMAHDNQVVAKPVRQALGLSTEDFKAAVCDLAGHGIIKPENDFSGFTMLDLKRKALDRHYRRLTAVPMKETVDRNEGNKDRSRLIRSINDTYFHGLMGPVWYQAIDTWFDQYGFESTVVYQMFVDAAGRNVLHGPNYLHKVAEDYHQHGIRTFMDLTKYKEETKRVHLVANKIGKKLRKKITEYDLPIIEKWLIAYGFDFDVIDVALAYSVRLSEPNLNYFDRILTNWHEAGIRTVEEAQRIEQNNQRQRKRKAASSTGNFSQREYDEEYLNQFYEFAYLEDKEEG